MCMYYYQHLRPIEKSFAFLLFHDCMQYVEQSKLIKCMDSIKFAVHNNSCIFQKGIIAVAFRKP